LRRSREKKPEEKKPSAPAYIVTFSDMVTLLLTFFVMLLSISSVKDPEIFFDSRDAFIANINSFGLGVLPGKALPPNFEYLKNKYAINSFSEKPSIRTIDAKEDQLREIFHRMMKSMNAIQSQIVAERADFTVTSVYFRNGKSNLDDQSKAYLDNFVTNLGLEGRSSGVKMYVLGLGRDEKTDREKWLISAKRAKAVADYIRSSISTSANIPVYSWGAGPGGVWIGEDSMVSENSQILIAILRD